MALIGYARVSSVGQSLDVQCDKLHHCDKVFEEKKSAASGKRPRLEACLEYVREGDTLIVTRLDRLARSTLHLCQIADELQRKGVHLQVIDRNRLEPAASRSEPLVRFQQERLGVVSHGVLCDHVHIVQKGCHSRATRAGRALEGERW